MEADLDHTVTYISIGSMAACHHDCHKLDILSLAQLHKKKKNSPKCDCTIYDKNQPPQAPYGHNKSLKKLNNHLFLVDSTII